MQQDLAVAKSLGDIAGECRAHGNLGSAYFSKGSYKEALTAHRHQLVLAMKCRDMQSAASALTSLGRFVYLFMFLLFPYRIIIFMYVNVIMIFYSKIKIIFFSYIIVVQLICDLKNYNFSS